MLLACSSKEAPSRTLFRGSFVCRSSSRKRNCPDVSFRTPPRGTTTRHKSCPFFWRTAFAECPNFGELELSRKSELTPANSCGRVTGTYKTSPSPLRLFEIRRVLQSNHKKSPRDGGIGLSECVVSAIPGPESLRVQVLWKQEGVQ